MTSSSQPLRHTWFEGSEAIADTDPQDRDWLTAKAIRTEVFVDEQACPVDEEFDGLDVAARHLLVHSVDGEPIATARWRTAPYFTDEDDGKPTAKLERFAVRRDFRGRGLGRHLVQALLDDAQAEGHQRFKLHAQEHLVDFYGSFGFTVIGDRFIESCLPHRYMVRPSPSPDVEPKP